MITVIGRQPSADTLRNIIGEYKTTQNIIVAWGARYIAPQEDTLVINGKTGINGIAQLELLAKHKINVPRFTTNINTAKDSIKNNIEIWGRRNNHTRGRDIKFANYKPQRTVNKIITTRKGNKVTRAFARNEYFNPAWLRSEYWVEVIPANTIVNEWRVHIFQGRCIARGRKVIGDKHITDPRIRSRSNGYFLEHTSELPDYIREASRRAVAALGYNFGAVDILQLTNNNYCVLEVNSAPALGSQYTIDAYAGAFDKLAQGKYRKIFTGKEE